MVLQAKDIEGLSRGRKRVMAAIVAAITAYIKEESLSTAIVAKKANLWVISGRSEAMRRRTLWQRRMTERSRLMQSVAFPPGEGGVRYGYRA
jgi:hypothetical protein